MKEFPEIFSIIDTETTGMRPPFSRIIDIGIIRVERGKVVERFQTLLNPGVSIPSYIKRFVHIDDEDLQDAPAFEEVALQVQELMKDAVFVAHNAPFDYAFLKSEFGRLDMPFSAETLCSVKLSRALVPKARSHSLDSVIDRYGIALSGQRHRALPDAEAVWEFFKKANNEHAAKDIRAAVARARSGMPGSATPSAMPSVARDTFGDMPDSAGVYFFYGPEQELLYIGKSKHVRTRARSHFHASDNKKEQRIQRETNTVSSVKTSGELSALLLEAALIKQQSPLYNRALRKRKLLVTASRGTDAEGYATLELSRTERIDPASGVLGVFRTTTQAKAKLRALAKEHRLCHKLLGLEPGDGACFAHQLKACNGACVGKEPAEAYNERFDAAFTERRLKTWPYSGTVMIDEKESEGSGTVIFVDNWALLGAFRYDADEFSPLTEGGMPDGFDYDTYKILVRYMLNPRNRRSVRTLTKKEFAQAYARATGSYEQELAYDDEPMIG